MDSAINEIKNTLEGTNSKITQAEYRISEVEDRMAFTRASLNFFTFGRASIVTKDQRKVLHTQETSAQRAELTAVIEAFGTMFNTPTFES